MSKKFTLGLWENYRQTLETEDEEEEEEEDDDDVMGDDVTSFPALIGLCRNCRVLLCKQYLLEKKAFTYSSK